MSALHFADRPHDTIFHEREKNRLTINRPFTGLLVLLTFVSSNLPVGNALTGHLPVINLSTNTLINEEQSVGPADLFSDFPEVTWGMSFQDAMKAIEKTGAHPAGFKDTQTELAWEGQFNNLNGRGTVLFKEGKVYQIAVIAQALDTQKEVFEAWQQKLTARHGAPKEKEDTSVSISRVWSLVRRRNPSTIQDSFVIELRSLKDPNSSAVEVRWVKQ